MGTEGNETAELLEQELEELRELRKTDPELAIQRAVDGWIKNEPHLSWLQSSYADVFDPLRERFSRGLTKWKWNGVPMQAAVDHFKTEEKVEEWPT